MDFKNRRAHPRLASSELPAPAQVRIPNRPAVSLVDLSLGGALLELPFQLPPSSRLTIELSTTREHVAVPFQLLRCYVADIKNGIKYHAAGAFDPCFRLPRSLTGDLTLSPSDRLVATLETFLRASERVDSASRGARFNGLLEWVVRMLQRGEALQAISKQLKKHLGELFPTLSIRKAVASAGADSSTSIRFFGFDFQSSRVLSAADRRFLRASAQLLSLIDAHAEPQDASPPAPAFVHSVPDRQTEPLRRDPWPLRRSA